MGNGHPRFFGWINSPPASIGTWRSCLPPRSIPAAPAAITPRSTWSGRRALADGAARVSDRGEHGPAGQRRLDGLADLPRDGAPWAAKRDGWDVRQDGVRGAAQLTMYLSAEGHCLRKSAELLGLGAISLRARPSGCRHRIDVPALRAARSSRTARPGLRPFCVAAAGTVNTGAIDPLDALADLCAEEALAPRRWRVRRRRRARSEPVAPRYAGLGARPTR